MTVAVLLAGLVVVPPVTLLVLWHALDRRGVAVLDDRRPDRDDRP